MPFKGIVQVHPTILLTLSLLQTCICMTVSSKVSFLKVHFQNMFYWKNKSNYSKFLFRIHYGRNFIFW